MSAATRRQAKTDERLKQEAATQPDLFDLDVERISDSWVSEIERALTFDEAQAAAEGFRGRLRGLLSALACSRGAAAAGARIAQLVAKVDAALEARVDEIGRAADCLIEHWAAEVRRAAQCGTPQARLKELEQQFCEGAGQQVSRGRRAQARARAFARWKEDLRLLGATVLATQVNPQKSLYPHLVYSRRLEE
ncbi:MAG: hypothetical protein NTW87_11890 [Planctomycetota bacterium]|nr:hypothetical protein [Planctomycetota bacterium]